MCWSGARLWPGMVPPNPSCWSGTRPDLPSFGCFLFTGMRPPNPLCWSGARLWPGMASPNPICWSEPRLVFVSVVILVLIAWRAVLSPRPACPDLHPGQPTNHLSTFDGSVRSPCFCCCRCQLLLLHRTFLCHLRLLLRVEDAANATTRPYLLTIASTVCSCDLLPSPFLLSGTLAACSERRAGPSMVIKAITAKDNKSIAPSTGPGHEASPTRMPKRPHCQSTRLTTTLV